MDHVAIDVKRNFFLHCRFRIGFCKKLFVLRKTSYVAFSVFPISPPMTWGWKLCSSKKHLSLLSWTLHQWTDPTLCKPFSWLTLPRANWLLNKFENVFPLTFTCPEAVFLGLSHIALIFVVCVDANLYFQWYYRFGKNVPRHKFISLTSTIFHAQYSVFAHGGYIRSRPCCATSF